MRKSIPILSAFLLAYCIANAQNTIQIQIDHGGLHCPYLGPRFEQRFTERAEVDSVYLDTKNSVGSLYLSDGNDLSDSDITEIIVHKVGYPKPEIKAIIRDAQ